MTDQKLQLTRLLAGVSDAISVSRQDVHRKRFFINTKDFYEQWFHQKQNLSTSERSIFAQEFEISNYSDFFYFSVVRKKMVGTKKGLQMVKTIN